MTTDNVLGGKYKDELAADYEQLKVNLSIVMKRLPRGAPLWAELRASLKIPTPFIDLIESRYHGVEIMGAKYEPAWIF